MPKPEDQKVFWNGMLTFPPSDSVVKMRCASPRVATLIET
jgi:hypothetical protein